jgi:hypothetical protein
MSGDYPFAEEVMKKAADKLGVKADDLQAFLWYLEKDVWDKNNWTNVNTQSLKKYRNPRNSSHKKTNKKNRSEDSPSLRLLSAKQFVSIYDILGELYSKK